MDKVSKYLKAVKELQFQSYKIVVIITVGYNCGFNFFE